MNRFVAVLAPFAALLPIAGAIGGDPQALAKPMVATESGVELLPAPAVVVSEDVQPFPLSDSFRSPVANQVRIEQRMTIRIAPRAPSPRPFVLDGPNFPHFTERNIGRCLPIAGIVGVQPGGGDRLMLFMRDRRTVSLGLEKSCRAQDFYSGFYVERSPDGQICVDRDRLQSRSGANCALTRIRQIVER
jgi:hypothetical protein